MRGIATALWGIDRAIDWVYDTLIVKAAQGVSRLGSAGAQRQRQPLRAVVPRRRRGRGHHRGLPARRQPMSDIILLLPFAALIVLNVLPRGTRGPRGSPPPLVFVLQTAAAILQPFGVMDWSFLGPLEKAVGLHAPGGQPGRPPPAHRGYRRAGLRARRHARASLQPRARFVFANLVLIALIGINGIAMVRDLFSLYVFIEVTSVAAFILVALRDEGRAFEGAWKYLLLSAVASVLMLASIGVVPADRGRRLLRRGSRRAGRPARRRPGSRRRCSCAGCS